MKTVKELNTFPLKAKSSAPIILAIAPSFTFTFIDKLVFQPGNGTLVTLNEFEPAAGVKVSKIINLSDDIARNTSSESARISTIPGSCVE